MRTTWLALMHVDRVVAAVLLSLVSEDASTMISSKRSNRCCGGSDWR